MQVNKILKDAIKELLKHSVASAALDAEVLLSFVIGKPREFILAHPEILLTRSQKSKFDKLVKRRSRLEPVAYLTHNKEFFGLDFFVDKNVLIPRPETELLVEKVLDYVTNKNVSTIADIGTGSGCIAISIAKNIPEIKVIASDNSKSALRIARKNALKHKVADRILFVHSDLLDHISEPVDIIIANLPYLPYSEQKKEISFEPKNALFGKNYGLELLEKIIIQAKEKLSQSGMLILEIHPPQSQHLPTIAKHIFPSAVIQIDKDLANKERILTIML